MREVVIKMSDEMYDWFLTGFPDKVDIDELQRLVIEGTILPKDHGDLINRDALDLKAIDEANYGSNYIRIAEAIVKSTKGEE